jgi:Ca2+/Na+ antiporter
VLPDRFLTFSSDFFEIAILLGACFIVNYVTADAKTNWIEGYAMVSFYVMIVSNILVLFRIYSLYYTEGIVLLVLSRAARNQANERSV